jgi:hypothetical protein
MHNIIIPPGPDKIPDKISLKLRKIGANLMEITVLAPEGILSSDPGGAEIDKIIIDPEIMKIDDAYKGRITLDGKYLLLLLNAGLLTYTKEGMRNTSAIPALTREPAGGMLTVLKILYAAVSRIDSEPVTIIDKKSQITLLLERARGGGGLKATMKTKYDTFILAENKSVNDDSWFFFMDLIDPGSLKIEPTLQFLKDIIVVVVDEETQERRKIPVVIAMRALKNDVPVETVAALS